MSVEVADSERVGRWRKEMTAGEREKFTLIVGARLRELG